jgi:hypothetical protein
MYEVKSKIKWQRVFADLLVSSLLLVAVNSYSGYDNFLVPLLISLSLFLIVTFWRMQSYLIVFDQDICFKRLVLKDYDISIDEILSIKVYNDKNRRAFSVKRDFLEVDTKDRYFTYYLDHFNLEEVNDLLKVLSRDCEVIYK